MIQLFNVYKSYNGSAPALIDISLSIKKGGFSFITGPSGAGKSTLLKILFRWENVDQGQVLVNGINLSKIKNNNLHILRRHIGVVFQDYKLLPGRTVYENVALAQEVIGGNKKSIRYNTMDALKSVGLTQKQRSYPLQLSGGEQQRVAIARAIVNSPKILLADEPTGNLDPDISKEILKLFIKANQVGITILLATHSPSLLQLTDLPVISLYRGRIARPPKKKGQLID